MSGLASAQSAVPKEAPREAQYGAAAAGADWEAVYAANVEPVYRFVYSRTGNRPDAEDVTSQVFMKAMPFLRRAAPEATRAYLFATARTELAMHWRAQYRLSVSSMDEFVAPAAAEPHSAVAERRVECLLKHLPERYRRVLELRFLRGFSVRETASEMSVSTGNAKVMQLRALRRLAELRADSSQCQG